MSNVMVVRMVDGSNVLAEVFQRNHELHTDYMFLNPVQLAIYPTEHGEATVSEPFVLGSDDTQYFVPREQIVCVANANEFMHRFYGSALLRFEVQKIMRKKTPNGIRVIDEEARNMLVSKKKELSEKYGLLDDEGDDPLSEFRVPEGTVVH